MLAWEVPGVGDPAVGEVSDARGRFAAPMPGPLPADPPPRAPASAAPRLGRHWHPLWPSLYWPPLAEVKATRLSLWMQHQSRRWHRMPPQIRQKKMLLLLDPLRRRLFQT